MNQSLINQSVMNQMLAKIEIRPFQTEDLTGIHSIYQENVLHDTASWEWIAPDQNELGTRIRSLLDQDFPFLVAAANGQVLGYCYASSFRPRAGYQYTVENTIYVDSAYRRLGIAKKLLHALIEACTAQGYRQMVAVIGGSERMASIDLHHKLGFQRVGLLPNIGLKHNRWLDCVLMQRALGNGHETIPPAPGRQE